MLQKPKKLNVPSHKQHSQIKLALVGSTQSGKTSFVSKYLNNQCPNYYEPTLGVQNRDKYMTSKNGGNMHITFWDFSGKADFMEIRNQFYKQCSKILIFVDLSSKNSVDQIDVWIKEIKEGAATSPIVVVGNKSDNKKVQNVDKISKSNGCQYMQISAKTGQGVNELVEQVVAQFK